jgi:hypothetical protein
MTETGAQRFEAAWREACANHENVADAMGRLLDEQGARLARVEVLADEWQASGDRLIERNRNRKSPAAEQRWVEGYSLCRSAVALRAALAPGAEEATS